MSLLFLLLLVCSIEAQPLKDQNDEALDDKTLIIVMVAVSLALLTCVGGCCFCTRSNRKWVDQAKIDIDAMTEIAETTKGKIEYTKWGDSPFALFMAGTPGFAHCAFGMQNHGFGIITVSRPGYGRTPLTDTNKTTEAQADLLAALMEHLGIEKYPVMAMSGGGPIAYRMALQYPDRVQCLMLQCALSGNFYAPEIDTLTPTVQAFIKTPSICRMGTYMLSNLGPSDISNDLMTANKIKPNSIKQEEANARAQEILNDPYHRTMLDEFKLLPKCLSCNPDGLDGYLNDLEQFQQIVPLGQVKVPVHMIHGDADPDAPYSQSVQAHEAISGSILITQPGGVHLTMFHANFKINFNQQIEFGKKHSGIPYDQAILDQKL